MRNFRTVVLGVLVVTIETVTWICAMILTIVRNTCRMGLCMLVFFHFKKNEGKKTFPLDDEDQVRANV